jgi:hypothetical protein
MPEPTEANRSDTREPRPKAKTASPGEIFDAGQTLRVKNYELAVLGVLFTLGTLGMLGTLQESASENPETSSFLAFVAFLA